MSELNEEEIELELKATLKKAAELYNELPNYGYKGRKRVKKFIDNIGLDIDDIYDEDDILDFIDYGNVSKFFEVIENDYCSVIKDAGWIEGDEEFENSDAYKTLHILYSNGIKFNSLADEFKLEACLKLYNILSLDEIEELAGKL